MTAKKELRPKLADVRKLQNDLVKALHDLNRIAYLMEVNRMHSSRQWDSAMYEVLEDHIRKQARANEIATAKVRNLIKLVKPIRDFAGFVRALIDIPPINLDLEPTDRAPIVINNVVSRSKP